MFIGCNDRLDEFIFMSGLVEELGEAVFHLMKEVHGMQRAERIGDEELASYREYLADVFVELKRMIKGRGDGRLKEGQERVIPFSVPRRLAQIWSADIDENIGKLDLIVARLKDPDYRLHIEDMRFAKAIYKVVSGISTEIFLSRYGMHSIGKLECF